MWITVGGPPLEELHLRAWWITDQHQTTRQIYIYFIITLIISLFYASDFLGLGFLDATSDLSVKLKSNDKLFSKNHFRCASYSPVLNATVMVEQAQWCLKDLYMQ